MAVHFFLPAASDSFFSGILYAQDFIHFFFFFEFIMVMIWRGQNLFSGYGVGEASQHNIKRWDGRLYNGIFTAIWGQSWGARIYIYKTNLYI